MFASWYYRDPNNSRCFSENCSFFNRERVLLKLCIFKDTNISVYFLLGTSRYSPPEYPYTIANPYANKLCAPTQSAWQTAEDNRSRSTSPQTQGLCTTTSCSSSPAPPLSHPPMHNTATTYTLPASYLAGSVPAAHGYPQSHCGSYSPTESLYPRTEHYVRSGYPPVHNSWPGDAPYSYH